MMNNYALVYCFALKTSDVISCDLIPLPDQREGAITELQWRDDRLNISGWYDARVVKLSNNIHELHEMMIDDYGRIISNARKTSFTDDTSNEIQCVQTGNESIEGHRGNIQIDLNKNDVYDAAKISDDEPIACHDLVTPPRPNVVSQENTEVQLKSNGNFTFRLPNQINTINNTWNKFQSALFPIKRSFHTMNTVPYNNNEIDCLDANKENTKRRKIDETEPNDKSEVHGEIFPNVTREQITIQERLLRMMRGCYENQRKKELLDVVLDQIHEVVFTQAPGKTEIYPRSEVFISNVRMNEIKTNWMTFGNWRRLATDILLEIYGQDFKYMTARGTRGTVGIHHRIYSAILALINGIPGQLITETELTKHINRNAWNRKNRLWGCNYYQPL